MDVNVPAIVSTSLLNTKYVLTRLSPVHYKYIENNTAKLDDDNQIACNHLDPN